jgi:hypothetical protein
MRSVPIIIGVVSSNLDQGEVYNIMLTYIEHILEKKFSASVMGPIVGHYSPSPLDRAKLNL